MNLIILLKIASNTKRRRLTDCEQQALINGLLENLDKGDEYLSIKNLEGGVLQLCYKYYVNLCSLQKYFEQNALVVNQKQFIFLHFA